jgi:fructose-1,6-bisphosphatase/sedoheptulose 1,7-bisphosphatase-like protein
MPSTERLLWATAIQAASTARTSWPRENVVFAATGVTKGDLLEGVRFFGGGARTHSLVMAFQMKQVRFVDTAHMFDRSRRPAVWLYI